MFRFLGFPLKNFWNKEFFLFENQKVFKDNENFSCLHF